MSSILMEGIRPASTPKGAGHSQRHGLRTADLHLGIDLQVCGVFGRDLDQDGSVGACCNHLGHSWKVRPGSDQR
jgi:hypothetical protein